MISVCMATYNGARFIREQIDSILPQLGSADELIISDDGSTDGTVEILKEYASSDSRVKLLWHEKNPAYSKIKCSRNFYYATDNFENALKNAKGDYIFLSDQDDIWMSDKVREMEESLMNSDLVMSNFNVIDANDKLLKKDFYGKSPLGKNLISNIIRSKFLGCCMAFSRSVLDIALPFPDRLLAHDLWIGLVAIKKFNISFLNKSLLNYRRTNCNVSPSTGRSKNSLFFRLKYRIRILTQLRLHLKKGATK